MAMALMILGMEDESGGKRWMYIKTKEVLVFVDASAQEEEEGQNCMSVTQILSFGCCGFDK
jgi:hypothetical protein